MTGCRAEAVRIARRCILDGLGAVRRRQRRGVGGGAGQGCARHRRPAGCAAAGRGRCEGAGQPGGARARHRRPCPRLGRHPGVARSGACLRPADASDRCRRSTAALVMAQKLGKRVRQATSMHRVPDRLRGRVQDLRMDAARPLPAAAMHSSGTVGTFGAARRGGEAARPQGRRSSPTRIGIAASMAAGIRCNFGTMTKPLHVGRACGERRHRGAAGGAAASRPIRNALDGRWGFYPGAWASGFDAKRRLRAGLRQDAGRSSSPASVDQAVSRPASSPTSRWTRC